MGFYINRLNVNKPFFLYILSYWIISLGDAFYFIAVTTLLINLSSSGLSAGFNILCIPIASILFSAVAGTIGDNFNEKFVVIIVDSLRGIVICLLALQKSILPVYFLMLILASLEILSGPSRKKLLVNLLKGKYITEANSLIAGIQGFNFIIGPVFAGFLITSISISTAFYLNSVSYLLSAVLLLAIPTHKTIIPYVKKSITFSYTNTFQQMKVGFSTIQKYPYIKKLILLGTFLSLGTASVNIIFYPFAFDILKVNSKTWGIMMSIYYGTNLISMMLVVFLAKFNIPMRLRMIYSGLFFIVISWIGYFFYRTVFSVILIQVLEGTAFSFVTILLNAQLQSHSPRNYTARILGTNDLINNIGKLFAILCTYTLLHILSLPLIFLINAFILSAFLAFRILNFKSLVGRDNDYRIGEKSRSKASA